MAVPPAHYPKREGFFAGKFCRLMTKVALANTLGTDVVCLLMVIAHQEDAAGYRGAVTWWNDQLKPLIGVKTDHALIRTRNKAIEAGWLHYEPGGKGVAGRYWVTVPASFRDLDAAPTADTAGEYGAVSTGAGDMANRISPAAGDRRSGGKVTGEAEEKRRESDRDRHNHSSLTHSQEESPTVSDAVAPPPVAADKPPRKEPAGPHADARRAFCARWLAKYGAEYKFVFGKHGKMLAGMLKHVGEDVPRLLAIFDRFFADDDPFFAAESGHAFDNLDRHFNRWLIAAPVASRQRSPPGPPRTKQQAADDFLRKQVMSVLDDPEPAPDPEGFDP